MEKEVKVKMEVKREMEEIIAFALIKFLYNNGQISEIVFRNIKKDLIKKISVENREYL